MQQQNEIAEKLLDEKSPILLTLRPASNNKLSDSITIKLWLRRAWGDKLKANAGTSYKEKGVINIIANQDDARVLHIPSEGSTLNFFEDRSLLIKQNSRLFQININGKAVIERKSNNEIVARLLSGFVIFIEPEHAFEAGSLDWLWSGNSGILQELKFGKNKLQLRIKNLESTSGETKSSLFEFIGRTRLKKGILWKLTACENDPTLQTGKEKFDKIMNSIKNICDNIKLIESTKSIFSMSNFNLDDQEMDADVYLEVRDNGNQNFITEELYKVNFKVHLKPEDINGHSSLSKETNWEVYTLKVENNEYKLYNHDEIQVLLNDIIINPSTNTDLLIKWESKQINQEQQYLKRSIMSVSEGKTITEIMPLYLVGAQANDAIVTKNNLAKDGYIWQPINLQINEQGFPPAIIRYQLDENLPEPVSASSDSRISTRLKILGGPSFAFHGLPNRYFYPRPTEQQLGWKLTIDMPDSYSDQNTSKPLRIEIVLKEISETVEPQTTSYYIKLHLNGVEVQLETPQMQFFTSRQYNSAFLPYMKKYDQDKIAGTLIFKNTLSLDSASKSNSKLIKALLKNNGFEFHSDLDATKVYVPNNVALINSVSAANPNIGMDRTYNIILLSKLSIVGVTFSKEGEQYVIEFTDVDQTFKNEYVGHILQIARIEADTEKLILTENYKITRGQSEPTVKFFVEAIENMYELFTSSTENYKYNVCIGINKFVLQRDGFVKTRPALAS